MKKWLFVIWVGLGTACASTGEFGRPEYTYDEIRVLNKSRQVLPDFSITVPATGAQFSCGNIAPQGLCANSFGQRRYRYNPIRIEWSYGTRNRQTDDFVVQVPDDFTTELPLKGVIEINTGGRVRAYVVQ